MENNYEYVDYISTKAAKYEKKRINDKVKKDNTEMGFDYKYVDYDLTKEASEDSVYVYVDYVSTKESIDHDKIINKKTTGHDYEMKIGNGNIDMKEDKKILSDFADIPGG